MKVSEAALFLYQKIKKTILNAFIFSIIIFLMLKICYLNKNLAKKTQKLCKYFPF